MTRNENAAKAKFLVASVFISAGLTFLFLKALETIISGSILFLEAVGVILVCLVLFIMLWGKSRRIMWRIKK